MDDDFIEPTVEYFDDKKDPSNYVHVGVDIKGLRKAMMSKSASNFEVQFTSTERSFCLTVIPKGNSKLSKYRYTVKRLPADISTDAKKTYARVEKDDEVVVYLHKATSGSWDRYLSVGLDHDGIANQRVPLGASARFACATGQQRNGVAIDLYNRSLSAFFDFIHSLKYASGTFCSL